ncbi:MAG: hypothetical protein AAF604_04730 [Acidobacteriota bacterium]
MTSEPKPLPSDGKILAGCAVIAAIFWFSFFTWRSTRRPAPPQEQAAPAPARPEGAIDALMACRRAVESQLKNPRSAKFKGALSGPLDDVHQLSEGEFLVQSWVEAETALGGTVRREFLCQADLGAKTAEVSFL